MVFFKSSVYTQWPLHSKIAHAIGEAHTVYHAQGVDLWVTSLRDSHEHNPGSAHHEAAAVDIRIKNLPKGTQGSVCRQIAKRLGEAFWVVLHPEDSPNHIHMQIVGGPGRREIPVLEA